MQLLLIYLIVPIIMIISGFIMLYKAPRKINRMFGYRTRMSTKSIETWKYSHAFCGKLWVIIGCVMLPISTLPMFFVIGREAYVVEGVGNVITIIQVAVMLISVLYVEFSLRRNFDKNGERKNDWEK